MRAKFITFRSNKDGTATLYFDKGINKHELIDLEGEEVEIGKPRETESEDKEYWIEVGRTQLFEQIKEWISAQAGEQK